MISTYFYTFLSRGVSAFGTLILGYVIARLSGASELGVFMLALSIMTGLGVLSRFGLDNLVLRLSSIAVKEKNLRYFRGIRNQSSFITILLGLIISLLILLNKDLITLSVFNSKRLNEIFPILSISIPFYALILLQASHVKSLRKPSFAPIIDTGSVALITSCLCLSLSYLGFRVDAQSALILLLISTTIILIIGYYLINVFIKEKFLSVEYDEKPIYINSVFNSSKDFFYIAFASYLTQWSTILIMGAFVENKDIGIYSTALRISMVVNFVLMVTNSIVAPLFATLHHEGRIDQLEKLVKKSTLMMLMMALPVAAFIVIMADEILGLFGPEFLIMKYYLWVLIFAQIVNVATGSVGFILNMTGHQKEMKNIVFFTSIITILLSLLVIPYYGLIGALVSNSTALVLQNLLALYFVRTKLGIKTI